MPNGQSPEKEAFNNYVTRFLPLAQTQRLALLGHHHSETIRINSDRMGEV
jgi:hypothetical protein